MNCSTALLRLLFVGSLVLTGLPEARAQEQAPPPDTEAALEEAPANPLDAASEGAESAESAEATADVTPSDPEAEESVELIDLVPAPVPETSGRELATPTIDPARAERALRNLAFAEEALARDRGGVDLTMAVAINLYVGGAMLALLSVSLMVGIVLESACINGIYDECTDGPGFLAGWIPATLGSLALFAGAYTTELRAAAGYRALNERSEALEASRNTRAALSPSIRWNGLGVTGTF